MVVSLHLSCCRCRLVAVALSLHLSCCCCCCSVPPPPGLPRTRLGLVLVCCWFSLRLARGPVLAMERAELRGVVVLCVGFCCRARKAVRMLPHSCRQGRDALPPCQHWREVKAYVVTLTSLPVPVFTSIMNFPLCVQVNCFLCGRSARDHASLARRPRTSQPRAAKPSRAAAIRSTWVGRSLVLVRSGGSSAGCPA
jgi:hypothetical protein